MQPRKLGRRLGFVLAATVMAASGVAPVGAAESGAIVFIKGDNVWIMPAGESGAARAVTTDGTAQAPYSAPTMDDEGTIYAVASLGDGVAGSGDIVRMRRSGARLGTFRPVPTGIIYSLDVSPDGSTLGFTWAQSSSTPIGGGGSVIGVAAFTGFAHADGSASSLPTDLQGYQPGFYDDDRAVLVSYSLDYTTTGLDTYQVGQASSQIWTLTCQDVLGDCVFPASPDIAASGERLVATGNDPNGILLGTQTRLVVWEMGGAPPAQPRVACQHGAESTGMDSPSWSPDGDALVWQQADGLYMASGFDSGCASAFGTAQRVVAGGSQPDWSPVSAGGSSTPTGPGGFTDTRDNDLGEAVARLVDAGITGGYPDGTFRPGEVVTRGQMASFLARALDLPPGSTTAFPDVEGIHAANIGALAAAGVAGGFPDGTYRPGQPVNRAQMAIFLMRALDLPPGDTGMFSDVPASAPHAAAVGALAETGITTGYPNGTFRPQDSVTRGQMALFLVRGFGL